MPLRSSFAARTRLQLGALGWLVAALTLACHSRRADPPAAASAATKNARPRADKTLIAAGVRWHGRVDLSNATAPRFAWSGSGFSAFLSGPRVTLQIRSAASPLNPIFYQVLIDGQRTARLPGAGEQRLLLGSGLGPGPHRVELYRETEGSFAESTFEGFSEGTLLEPPAGPDRLIEIVGDSISAGYGNLGREEHPDRGPDPHGGCGFTTETESAYDTYGAIAARALAANLSIVAVSGWGIYRDRGGRFERVLPAVFERALGVPPGPAWPFALQPDAVLVNLGTNDFALGDPGASAFEDAYLAFLGTLRRRYPNAYLLCAVGPMLGGREHDAAKQYVEVAAQRARKAGDARVDWLDFGEQDASLGTGCHYHPNLSLHQVMADTLVARLREKLGW